MVATTFNLYMTPALDTAGVQMSGAKLYFYDFGTTTPKTVHSDTGQSIAHAHPVVADSAGFFDPVYLTQGGGYRVTLKTSAGVTVGDPIDFYAPVTVVPTFTNLAGTATDSATLVSLFAQKASPSFTGTVSSAGAVSVTTTTAGPGAITDDGFMFYNATNGLTLMGFGATYDVALKNKSDAVAMGVLTGTTSVSFTGAIFTVGNASIGGSMLSVNATGGVGYGTGAGGTVTQITSKSTGVTLNKVCGQITMNNAALAAATTVSFTLTNSAIAATDTIQVSIASGGTVGAYTVTVSAVAAGSCSISVRNETAGSLGEAIVLNFTVLKGVAA